ncbi:AcrR family transcriptional regulator [Actinoalloteichus hoggarensis]|uniref:HTH-type transcriptional regulator MtrR n=1 Tax=Actinoalloteichus hoggarensis TaxID=1470176 RepID=A0A221W423_9PSEU|nr:TetR/AcrR family transcriptional regulator [Actinoalloteichus hoggarensis]ASO20622.1 HTH-type transcriptional regulator MtrR [Actinoalloteichus hoggarensis]MBB5923663.1 AcrR family transcriptional regulator [Actinoalloteichus hoggarensis]
MRLSRVERRVQILRAATAVLVARGGFAATSLEDVAQASGVTRAILYRHFDSKDDLLRAAVDRAATDLHAATTTDGELRDDSIGGMLRWAHGEPAAFRLLFHHAVREPACRTQVDALLDAMTAAVLPHTGDQTGPWGRWTARLATSTVVEAVLCWLDVGCPDPDEALGRILRVVEGIVSAAPVASRAPAD